MNTHHSKLANPIIPNATFPGQAVQILNNVACECAVNVRAFAQPL